MLKSAEHSVNDLKHQCSQILCKSLFKSFVAKCLCLDMFVPLGMSPPCPNATLLQHRDISQYFRQPIIPFYCHHIIWRVGQPSQLL